MKCRLQARLRVTLQATQQPQRLEKGRVGAGPVSIILWSMLGCIDKSPARLLKLSQAQSVSGAKDREMRDKILPQQRKSCIFLAIELLANSSANRTRGFRRCDEKKPKCLACCRLQLDCTFPAAPRRVRTGFNIRFTEPLIPRAGQGSVPETEAPGIVLPITPLPELLSPGDRNTGQPGQDVGVQDEVDTQQQLLGPPSLSDATFESAPSFGDFEDLWGIVNMTDSVDLEFQTPDDFQRAAPDVIGHEDGRPRSRSSMDRSTPSHGVSTRHMVNIRPEDQEPLQHYLTTMTQFAKMRNSNQETVYATIFSTTALSHEPLFQAMMAWSSLHLAQMKKSSTEDAERRYARASTLLLEDADPLERIDVALSTTWILLQYEHILADGVEKFCSLLKYAADILQRLFNRFDKIEVKRRLGVNGVRALIWMSTYDARATLFGTAGYLLGTLRRCPYIYDLLSLGAPPADVHSHVRPPKPSYEASLRLALRLRMVMGQIRLLTLSQNSEERRRGWSAVDDSLKTLRSELDEKYNAAAQNALSVARGHMPAVAEASSEQYNRMMLCATFYGAIILYQHFRPAIEVFTVDELTPLRDCGLRIIRLANCASRARPDSPQSVWPHLLLLAGIVCQDPVYQSWAIQSLQKAEVWGRNLYKTRILLEAFADHAGSGIGLDVITTLMEQITGPFII